MKIIIITLLSIIQLIQCSFDYNEQLGQDLAGFSLAAYCNEDQIKEWNCGFACDLNNKGVIDIYNLSNSTMHASGYIAYSIAHDSIIIVFRGTLPWSFKNWLRDLNTFKVKYPYCNNQCYVHDGFLQHFLDLQDQLISSFKEIRLKYPKAKIYVTGHSLGAAMGALSLPIIVSLNKNKPVDVFYNYGSPRVGDDKYAEWFSSMKYAKSYSRINNGADPVPHLPPVQYPFEFKHYGQEVFYESFSNIERRKYKKCKESEKSECAEGQIFAYSIPDHLSFFGWNWADTLISCSF